MTTITPTIIPTRKLDCWRATHPNRYQFVLSDSRPLERRLSAENSCIRNRKPWLIDNTFYVSSQSSGTLPLTSPDPKEFHELQWQVNHGSTGRFVHERDISIAASDQCTMSTPPDTATTKSSLEKTFRTSRSSLLEKIVDRINKERKNLELQQRRRS